MNFSCISLGSEYNNCEEPRKVGENMKDERSECSLYGNLRKLGHFLFIYTGNKTGQRRALIFLDEKKETSQRELQTKLDIQSSSLAEMLGKMENEGLVERRKDEDDARKVLIRLSEKGHQEAKRQKAQLDAIQLQLFATLTEEEKDELLHLLDKLNVYWDQLRHDPEFLNQLEGVKKK